MPCEPPEARLRLHPVRACYKRPSLSAALRLLRCCSLFQLAFHVGDHLFGRVEGTIVGTLGSFLKLRINRTALRRRVLIVSRGKLGNDVDDAAGESKFQPIAGFDTSAAPEGFRNDDGTLLFNDCSHGGALTARTSSIAREGQARFTPPLSPACPYWRRSFLAPVCPGTRGPPPPPAPPPGTDKGCIGWRRSWRDNP